MAILAEILRTTRESKRGKRKTDIIQSVNLNHPQADKYLHLLLYNGLLALDSNDRYKITEKGSRLMKTLELLDLTLR